MKGPRVAEARGFARPTAATRVYSRWSSWASQREVSSLGALPVIAEETRSSTLTLTASAYRFDTLPRRIERRLLSTVRRRRLFGTFSADMKSSLTKPRFTDADAEAFSETLSSFSKNFTGSETLLADLQESRDARLSKWNELLDPKTLFDTGFGGVFDPQSLHTEDGTIRRLGENTAAGILPDTVRTRLACPAGNIELKAKFGRNWTAASVIGLVLNLSDNHRYDFLLTVPQFDYRDTTADDLADLPTTASVLGSLFSSRLEMYILRDGQPLMSRSLTVPEGRLRLLARREGGRLSFTVNDNETIHFEDPFPLSSTEPGMFGLYFPKNVELEARTSSLNRRPRSA